MTETKTDTQIEGWKCKACDQWFDSKPDFILHRYMVHGEIELA
jgi:hypothetical protein